MEAYGAVVIVGYAIMLSFIVLESRRSGFEPRRVLGTVAWATLGCLAGGRLAYMLVNLDYSLADPWRLLRFWEGGLVSFGGLIGMHLATAVYARRAGLPFGRVMDLASLSGVLALFLGRWGCFFAGCDYGIRAAPDLPWSVVF